MLCLTIMLSTDHEDLKLLGLTVATEETDGFKRFMRSADIFNLPIKVNCLASFVDFCQSQASNEQLTCRAYSHGTKRHSYLNN